MRPVLATLLTVCYAAAAVSADEKPQQAYENPSHVILRSHLRDALDPARTEALEDSVEAASVGDGHRQVRKLLGLAYRDFGSRGQVQNFNRLLGNSTGKFIPGLLTLLGMDKRHEGDIREVAFDAPAAANQTGVWRLHKMAYRPRGSGGGTRLSCLLVHIAAHGSFDVLLVASATADAAAVGDEDTLVLETKLADQMGWADRREARLTRVGHEAGLTEEDLTALMTYTELICLRRLGAHFHVAYDT